jgi:hypothetical protein
MKSKEFVVRPKHLITGLLIFIALAILGIAVVPQVISNFTTPKPAEIAARDGAQAFLSTDFEQGQDAWLANVCKVASIEGCSIIKKSIAPMLWSSVERSKIRQSCQATKAELLTDTPASDKKAHSQVWKVNLDCVDVLTSKSNTGDVNVLVSEHEQAWKFDLVLFTQENQNAVQQ